MDKYIIENETKDTLITIALLLTVFPWVEMLAIGSLGHRLDVPFLFKFGFFEVVLLNVACFPFRGSGFTKKIVKTIQKD